MKKSLYQGLGKAACIYLLVGLSIGLAVWITSSIIGFVFAPPVPFAIITNIFTLVVGLAVFISQIVLVSIAYRKLKKSSKETVNGEATINPGVHIDNHNVRSCPKCGYRIQKGTTDCPICGAKI